MKHKINNQRFSIRFCNLAKAYGFNTVGSFQKFLLNLNPSIKTFDCRLYSYKNRCLAEIQDFIKELKNSSYN